MLEIHFNKHSKKKCFTTFSQRQVLAEPKQSIFFFDFVWSTEAIVKIYRHNGCEFEVSIDGRYINNAILMVKKLDEF